MSCKSLLNAALAFAAIAWLSGNPARVLAQVQARPEAPPFDAARLTMQPPPPEGFAIRAGRLFDPKTGTNLTNQVILIKGDRIVEVGPADRIKIPAGVSVIDLSRATVLPGLIDRHVHLMQDPEPNEARALLVGHRGSRSHRHVRNCRSGCWTEPCRRSGRQPESPVQVPAAAPARKHANVFCEEAWCSFKNG